MRSPEEKKKMELPWPGSLVTTSLLYLPTPPTLHSTADEAAKTKNERETNG